MIKKVLARQVFDSRGVPTVETEIRFNNSSVRAIVPSGKSTGEYEAIELRDGEKAFFGQGVDKAVKNVNENIAPKIQEGKFDSQQEIDEFLNELDGTANKANLGANAILSVSMAFSRYMAAKNQIPLYKYFADVMKNNQLTLPIPFLNVINGGAHAENKLDIQEYMIAPVGAKTFREAMTMASEMYHQLKKEIGEKYGSSSTNVGDEGGFAPNMTNSEEPLQVIMKAAEELGYEKDIKIAMDAAASEFFKDDKYHVDGKEMDGTKLTELYKELSSKYPIISIEDPFDENDFHSFAHLTKEIGDKIQIVGDDLLVTNVRRINKAMETNSCNALLLKVNQIGTITESINAARLSVDNDWGVMVSHRSGETEDNIIADLVVGLGNGQIKSGAPCRSERLAKYNQLLRIEEDLGDEAKYATWNKG